MKKRHTLLLPFSLALGIAIIYIWFNWEYFLLKNDWWTIHGEYLESLFSPFSALLSGLGLLGVICTIFYQMLSFEVQQFESSFFELLKIHRENKKDLTYTVQVTTTQKKDIRPLGSVCFKDIEETTYTKNETLRGEEAVQELFSMLAQIFKALSMPESDIALAKLGVSDDQIENLQYEISSYSMSDGDEEEGLSTKVALKIAYPLFERTTNYALFPYFTHLYRTLKFIRKKAPKKYWRYTNILRAQLSQYEFALLYYNALFSGVNEKHHGDSPLKELIENTSFFHTFYARNADFMFGMNEPSLANVYDNRAFNEPLSLLKKCRLAFSFTTLCDCFKTIVSPVYALVIAIKRHYTYVTTALLLLRLPTALIWQFITTPKATHDAPKSLPLKKTTTISPAFAQKLTKQYGRTPIFWTTAIKKAKLQISLKELEKAFSEGEDITNYFDAVIKKELKIKNTNNG